MLFLQKDSLKLMLLVTERSLQRWLLFSISGVGLQLIQTSLILRTVMAFRGCCQLLKVETAFKQSVRTVNQYWRDLQFTSTSFLFIKHQINLLC